MWRRVWLFIREGKKRRTYSLRWYSEDGRVRTETVGTDKKRAEDCRRQRESELNSGAFQETQQITLEEFANEHLRLMEGRVSGKTIIAYRETLEHFQAQGGNRPLDRVTQKVIEEYIVARLRVRRPATCNKELRFLKAAFNRAVQRKYLRENPCRWIKPVREPEVDVRVLSVEEVRKLLLACEEPRILLFVFLALTTGMRRGELCALEWMDVNLETGLVTVRNKEGHLTKSRRIRQLALVPAAVEMLRQWKIGHPGPKLFEPEGREDVPNSMTHRFETVVKCAKIADCTVHDLRRTFVSHLAMAGINAVVVQRLAGHCSAATTEKYYTGILPEALRLAPGRLPYADAVSIVSKSYHEAFSHTGAEFAVA